jgi:hypothetical protein
VILWQCVLLTTNSFSAQARGSEVWTYQKLFDKADIVIIGRSLSTEDTQEITALEKVYDVVGLSSTISVRLVLKGDPDLASVVLHHYRRKKYEPPPESLSLVRFKSNQARYLMFLKREKDGRYAPVSGQVDPALFSILKVEGIAD